MTCSFLATTLQKWLLLKVPRKPFHGPGCTSDIRLEHANILSMPVEVYPIVAFTGLAVCGASWYLTRLARSPDVIWDKKVRVLITCSKAYARTTPRHGTTSSRALSTSL